MTWPTDQMLAQAGLSRAEYDFRLREERKTWSADQYAGRHDERRALHADRWAEYFSILGCRITPESAARVARVLVVGCGLGANEWDACVEFPNAEVHAIDLSEPDEEPEMWRRAKAQFGPRLKYFKGYDVQRDRPGESYDVIVALSVLHHCPFIEEAWSNIKKMLAPRGILMVSEYVGGRGLQAEPVRDRVAARVWEALPVAYKTRPDGSVQIPRTTYSAQHAAGFESICSPRLREAAMRAGFGMVTERLLHPLSAYRIIPLGQRTQASANPEIDRLIEAFEDVLMGEGWVSGEDWYALLGNPAAGQ